MTDACRLFVLYSKVDTRLTDSNVLSLYTACTAVIGVNATGDAGDASPAIFGEPGTKCLISPPQKPVKIVTNREAKKA